MGYLENKKKKGSLWSSFRYAFEGVRYAVCTERNMWIHICVAVCVIVAGFYFQLSKYEWIIILLVMTNVIGLEMLNTALEAAVDLVTEDYHPLAKKAKDIAAGAVLVTVVTAIIIGLIIFIPRLGL